MMEVVVFRDGNGGLEFALCNEVIAGMLAEQHRENAAAMAVPKSWDVRMQSGCINMLRYDTDGHVSLHRINGKNGNGDEWTVISNGSYVSRTNPGLIKQSVDSLAGDVVLVKIDPKLAGYHEKIRYASDSSIVGIRRYYSDSIELCPVGDDWPHYVFVRTSAIGKLAEGGGLAADFEEFLSRCEAESLKIDSIAAGGKYLDISTDSGLLTFVGSRLKRRAFDNSSNEASRGGGRIVGQVVLGKNVSLGEGSLVAGPSILGDNVRIEDGAIVCKSIIASGVSIARDQVVNNSVLAGGESVVNSDIPGDRCRSASWDDDTFSSNYFRTWPRWSYPRYVKRIFDIIASLTILGLFTPFFPIIVLAIKLSSPGSIFYRARRQGLGGKEFDCLKFRSMSTAAEGLQEKLQVVNQVDGPQFKMENDPRINAVGHFLRDTNIDEIPQFINVLRGEMSIIGPRPSPEHENDSCPHWRYARLSVRPGITGLWQICRTRQEGRDFQEWIQYDTEYVRKLSFKLDLWIFFKTAQKLINGFVDQF